MQAPFTPGPAALRNKTYPIRLVLQALTLYNLGYSLNETAKRLKSKSGRAVSPTTIATWIGAHKEQTTFRRLRAEATTIYPPDANHPLDQALSPAGLRLRVSPLEARALAPQSAAPALRGACDFPREHSLNVPARTLPPRGRSEGPRLASAPGFRRSRPHRHQSQREHGHRQLPALIIPAVGSNKLRHETLQNFMLANDSSTVAVEIPIWLTEDEIAISKRRYGIELAAGGAPRSITGHIDFLQVRNDAVHILDYKPDARTNKPIAQLAIYALALTMRVPGLKLFDIKCAWFNEDEYNEFFPRTLFAKHSDQRPR